jgi:PAS domain S-box-containing protein
MYEMHRISPTAFEPTHENFLTLIHPDDRSAFSEWISAQVAGVATGPIEFRAVTPDGVVRWIRTIAEREGDEHGDFVALSGAAQDITDSKLATDALARSESKWRHVLASVPQIGISLDVEGRIIFANAYFLALTGWEEGEVLGRDWFDTCIPEGSREEIRGVFALAMADRNGLGVTSYENPIITRSGELREVAWSNVLTRGSDGGIVDVTCLGVDITERRRAQDEAARKLEELQRWRQATLGREGRILELKREVNTLCDKLGLPHPYASADAISNDGAR